MADGYATALGAAGATVLAMQGFGSYQGEWWAKVRTADGRVGWVSGSFGSCSGCDAFEAEFGYSDPECDRHQYTYGADADAEKLACAECVAMRAEHRSRLASFGARYLDDLKTQPEAEAAASKNLDWDMDAAEMVDFIRGNA